MRRLYTLLICLAAPVAFLVVLWRGLRDRQYWQGLGERFGFGAPLPGDAPGIWVHAVSLGEVTAAAPLVRELQRRHPAQRLLLSTATPTGRARAAALFGQTIAIRYLPYDLPGAVRRFLRRMRPQTLIIMETELWPNLFRECARQSVPIVLASARLSEKSVARYLRLGGLFRGLFANDVVVAAQTAADAARFAAIGADPRRTHVVGNVKFDIDIDAQVLEAGRRLRASLFGTRPVWIAGSTHAGEEEQVLAAHDELRRQIPDALLVLVPRHPNRFEAVADLVVRRGLKLARRSARRPVAAEEGVFLVDSIGELLGFYAAADLAFVGGSLVPIGGHNLLEPAALGIPVLTGPADANGREIAMLLTDLGAVWRVADAHALAVALQQLFVDPARRERVGALGREAVAANRGSVARVLDLVT
ncbi:MAG: lipid IV(A) 3-deoxy-D-manno-octulosonic acid transferase [Steroidobacterales bacterium]